VLNWAPHLQTTWSTGTPPHKLLDLSHLLHTPTALTSGRAPPTITEEDTDWWTSRVHLDILVKTEISAPGKTGIPLFIQHSTTTLSCQRVYVQSMKYCTCFVTKNYFVLPGLYKYTVTTSEIKVKNKMCCNTMWQHNI